MSNKVFHFSNTGISSGQRFYLKDDVSGIFVRNLNIDSNFPVVASNLVYNTGNQTISGVKTFDVTPIIFGNPIINGGYDNEIHVSQTDGNDTTGNGDLLNPVATITKALTLVTAQRRKIIVHSGGYSESPTITQSYTTITSEQQKGDDVVINGTITTNVGCTIAGLKMTNLTIATSSGTGSVNILGCDITGTLTKNSNADYTLIRFCDIGTVNITGAGLVAMLGGNPNFITINNAAAQVIVKTATTVAPILTNGNANFVDSIVIAAGATSNAITTAAGTIVTLANSQFIVPAYNNVARVSLGGFYSIFNCVYDKPNSTLTGTSTNSIDYFQYINADKFITQGGTSSQYVKGDGSLELLPTTIVYTTGNQTISGNKTFINNLSVQETGIFNALDLSNISEFNFSGTDINLINGNVNISGGTLYISGNPVLTGVIQTITNVVYTTGIQNIGGSKTFSSNAFFTNDINIAQNLRVTGAAFFSDNLNVTGNLNVSGNINNSTLVLTKNKQTISGDKTFVDKININAYTGNGYDITNNEFALNIGGNTNDNAGILVDAYGTNPPQILMRRARGTPTGLSGVLKDDVLFNLQARGYVSGLNAYSTNSRAAIRLIASEDWVGATNYTGQGANILFRGTNTGNALAIDKALINSSGLNILDGNIYISGKQVLTGVNLTPYALSNQVVYKTGDQTISGVKTFANDIKVSGSGIFNALDLNSIDLLSISGVDINITSGNVLLTNRPTVNGSGALLIGEVITNVVYATGRQTISGVKTFIDSGVFSLSGTSPLSLPSNPLSIVGSGNTYLQLNIQNRATGKFASADLVITANNGTDSSNYINIGINNSGYSDPAFTNGTGFDGYLYIDGGNLDIGTRTLEKNIEFHVGGSTTNKTIARIDSSGINIVSGTYRINDVPYNTSTITFLSSNGNLAIGQNFISNVGGGYSPTATDRLLPIMDACTARKASISLLNSGPGNNIVGITGLFINTSTVPPQTGIINAAISAPSGSNQFTFTGAFATPININAGDNVVCSLNSNNTATNVRTSATIYLYN